MSQARKGDELVGRRGDEPGGEEVVDGGREGESEDAVKEVRS
jgi:hypothetical protein